MYGFLIMGGLAVHVYDIHSCLSLAKLIPDAVELLAHR